MNRKMLFGIAIVLMMLLSAVPAYAWTYPDETHDMKWEGFGPRLDRIHIRLFENERAEWEALKAGEIDMTDWPLSEAYYKEFTTTYKDKIYVEDYGAELGYFVVDMNNDNSPEKAPGFPNPLYKKNPLGFVQVGTEPYKETAAKFRKAIWRTLDRDYLITNVWKGFAVKMTTPVPPAMGPIMHPKAYVPVEEGGLEWGFNLANASAILNAAGFVDTDGDGWRNFPEALGGDGSNIVLIYYGREDHEERKLLATYHAGWIQSIGIKVDLRLRDRRTCFYEVMVYKNFHLYTGGWSVGRDPDHLTLYHSGYYWHPGFCYNYGRVNDTDFDAKVDELLTANTYEEVVQKAHEAQEIFNLKVFGALFAVSTSGYKAFYRKYTGGTACTPVTPDDGENQYRGLNWTHIVNVGSYGPDSFWTFLNAYPDSPNTQWGDGQHMTMRWGFKTDTMEKPSNPCYAEWVWDWNVLGLTYESLLARDPYTYEWIPWLVKDFEVFTWVDPSDGLTKSGVRFVLRDDVYWSDGTPLTAADVEYTLVEMDDELIDLGFGPPWWYSNTAYIKSFYITDPYNIEVLLDIKSYFAVGWIGGCVILPKHVWKTLIETEKAHPGTIDFWGPYVDPNVIGTGPYRFVKYTETVDTLLVANAPGSTVQTAWPGSTPITSPGYFRYYPFTVAFHVKLPPEMEYRAKLPFEPMFTAAFEFTNMYVDKPMDINVTIITNATGVDTPLIENYPITLEPGATYTSDINFTWGCIVRTRGYWHRLTDWEQGPPWQYEIKKIIEWHVRRDIDVWIHLPDCTWEHITIPKCTWIKIEFHVTFKWNKFMGEKCVQYRFEGDQLLWMTRPEDIGGSTYHDDIGMPGYPYKKEIPTPDFKVDMKDVGAAARAFGSYPGHARWWSVADLNKDYRVDMKDIGAIARRFGWAK